MKAAVFAVLSACVAAYPNGATWARKPQLGWSTWCTDDLCGIIDSCNEDEIHTIADAIVSSGMHAVGYSLVLLDDCWASSVRDSDGNLAPNATRFPSGIPALVNYLETRGLYLGLYTCAGTKTCHGGLPGSEGYYDVDAKRFASWGVKYVKSDNCNINNGQPPHINFANFSHYLNATGVPMAFATCEWGEDSVWTWGASVAQQFRVTNDHLPLWSWPGQGTSDIIEIMANPAISGSSVEYGYADADFLMTGLILTNTESETEFAMWALWGGPLIVSTDVRNMSAWKQALLTNTDILAINQDALLRPGYRVRADNVSGTQLWAKHLDGGDVAVVLYNKNDSGTRDIAVSWTEVGWPASSAVRVYDVWSHSVVSPSAVGNATALAVPPHGHRMWRLHLAT